MTWRRHAGDSKFHTGAPGRSSFLTLCDGRWSLSADADGLIETQEDPPTADRCELCDRRATERERTEVHVLVDNLLAMDELAGPPDCLTPAQAIRIAREVQRLREDLDTRTNELHVVERELADQHMFAKALAVTPSGAAERVTKLEAALVDLVCIAQSAARRGLLSQRERERLRELERLVPQ